MTFYKIELAPTRAKLKFLPGFSQDDVQADI